MTTVSTPTQKAAPTKGQRAKKLAVGVLIGSVLVGGAGTFAMWQATEGFGEDVGTAVSGELALSMADATITDLKTGTPITDLATYPLVPGDQIEVRAGADVALDGINLLAVLDADGVVEGGSLDEFVDIDSRFVDGEGNPIGLPVHYTAAEGLTGTTLDGVFDAEYVATVTFNEITPDRVLTTSELVDFTAGTVSLKQVDEFPAGGSGAKIIDTETYDDGEGTTTRLDFYDDESLVETVTSPDGKVKTTKYNSDDKIVEMTLKKPGAPSGLGTVVDTITDEYDGEITKIDFYDDDSMVETITSPDGTVTVKTYDPDGDMIHYIMREPGDGPVGPGEEVEEPDTPVDYTKAGWRWDYQPSAEVFGEAGGMMHFGFGWQKLDEFGTGFHVDLKNVPLDGGSAGHPTRTYYSHETAGTNASYPLDAGESYTYEITLTAKVNGVPSAPVTMTVSVSSDTVTVL